MRAIFGLNIFEFKEDIHYLYKYISWEYTILTCQFTFVINYIHYTTLLATTKIQIIISIWFYIDIDHPKPSLYNHKNKPQHIEGTEKVVKDNIFDPIIKTETNNGLQNVSMEQQSYWIIILFNTMYNIIIYWMHMDMVKGGEIKYLLLHKPNPLHWNCMIYIR